MRVGQARKRDANEADIITALQRIGCVTRRISEPGFADVVAYKPSHGVRLIEVKSRTGTLTPAQVEHRRDGWPVHVVRNAAEALALFGIVQ